MATGGSPYRATRRATKRLVMRPPPDPRAAAAAEWEAVSHPCAIIETNRHPRFRPAGRRS